MNNNRITSHRSYGWEYSKKVKSYVKGMIRVKEFWIFVK